MLLYELCCTVCKKSFKERDHWLHHLLDSDHQKTASLEISEWDRKLKKCALVAFASCPIMTCALELLKYFSEEMSIVTDFISTEQPHVGILQFENNDKVNDILTKLKDCGSQVEINSEQIQFRKASTCRDLEWKLLLPKVALVDSKHHQQETTKQGQKRKCDSLSPPESGSTKKPKIQVLHDPGSLILETYTVKLEPVYELTLQHQFKFLQESVRIPDGDFNIAVNLVSQLREMFRVRFPQCEIYMFRNWYLQLRNPSSNELLLGIDHNGELTQEIKQNDEGNRMPCKLQDVQWLTKEANSLLQIEKLDNQPNVNLQSPNHAVYYSHKPTAIKLGMIFHRRIFLEIQTCRLVDYLCYFDLRVKPLLTLIFFWSKTNNISLSNKTKTKTITGQLKRTPEPAALEWLVILFLSHRRIIPTPREILEFSKNEAVKYCGVNVGITVDFERCQYWQSLCSPGLPPNEGSDEFIINIITLAADFFTLFSGLRSNSWILNCKDGEIILRNDFINKKPFTQWRTKLTMEEIQKLRRVQWFKANEQETTMTLTHPLSVMQQFSFSSAHFIDKVCPVMKSTAEKIKLFLDGRTLNGGDLMSLLQIAQ